MGARAGAAEGQQLRASVWRAGSVPERAQHSQVSCDGTGKGFVFPGDRRSPRKTVSAEVQSRKAEDSQTGPVHPTYHDLDPC